MHLVFSYGTLKDKFFGVKVREAVLESNYEMGSYGVYPMLKPSKKLNPQRIKGHILELSDSQFVETDRYEGYPNLYNRKEMKVECGGELVTAWVYVQGNPLG